MQVITYSLRADGQRSDQYYRDVAKCADDTIAEGDTRLYRIVAAYRSSLNDNGRETARSNAEYYYELLTLGILWRVYAHDALALADLPRHILTRLTRLRASAATVKPAVDAIRVVLGNWLFSTGRNSDPAMLTIEHTYKLIGWLSATGCFEQEVKRLTNLCEWLMKQPAQQAEQHLADVLMFAAWFETRSLEALGRYSDHVNEFIADVDRRYRWRADRTLCRRARVEYHMSMVGTEILNRAFRDEFLGTPRKVVLVPPCMCLQAERCQAKLSALGSHCAHCTPQCRVHHISLLGEKHGFQVMIMPDELSVFSDQSASAGKSSVLGIVGVSCVLTNAPGGWEARALGVPAQGLPLDYCGCRWHWHKEGIPTDVNVFQLRRIMGIAEPL